MRLFVALDLPAETIRNLEHLVDRLRPTARISWVQPSNMHVTLKFIGEWKDERLQEITSALNAVTRPGIIPVSIRDVGFFPTPKSPRVFWVGVGGPGLAELAADIDRATSALGIESEKRAFSPHLTLARIKDRLDLQPLRDAIASEPSLDFGRFEARSFYLYRSHLRPTGAIYTRLREFALE